MKEFVLTGATELEGFDYTAPNLSSLIPRPFTEAVPLTWNKFILPYIRSGVLFVREVDYCKWLLA